MSVVSSVPLVAVGQRIAASLWNTSAAAVNALLYKALFDVSYTAGGMAAPAGGTWAPVPLDAVNHDDLGVFSSAAPTRFTPSQAGLWLVTARAGFTGGAGDRAVSIRTNGGADYGPRQVITPATSAPWRGACPDLIFFNGTTDYAELMVYQDSGGARAPDITATRLTAVWMRS